MLKQIGMAIVINLTLTAFITWFYNGSGWVLEPLDVVGVGGTRGFVFDFVVTTFLLSMLTIISVSRVAHKSIWDHYKWPFTGGRLITMAQDFVKPQLIVIGILGALAITIVLVPLLLVGLIIVGGRETFTVTGYVWFKAIYATLLAVSITIVVVLDSFKRTTTFNDQG